MRQLIPLALSVNTIVLMWLAGNKNKLSWVLGLAGQAVWVLFVVVFNAWGLLPLCVALTFVYGRNLWRWVTEDRAEVHTNYNTGELCRCAVHSPTTDPEEA